MKIKHPTAPKPKKNSPIKPTVRLPKGMWLVKSTVAGQKKHKLFIDKSSYHHLQADHFPSQTLEFPEAINKNIPVIYNTTPV